MADDEKDEKDDAEVSDDALLDLDESDEDEDEDKAEEGEEEYGYRTDAPSRARSCYTLRMHTILKFFGTAAAVFLTVEFVPGIAVSGGWTTILLVALVWSVITMVIRPILQILTLPITLITFGLFAFVLNALLFWAMELIVPGFDVGGFLPAILGAVVLSIANWLIQKVL